MEKNKTKKLILVAIYIALACALDIIKEFIPFLNMPSGGSINIALIPIALASFHLGVKDGCITGLLWFIVSSIIGLNKYFISFGQIIFDYIIPSIIVGASSFIYKKKNIIEIEIGLFITMLIRTFALCFSGAYFWFDGEGGALSIASWIYTISYNVPYSIATLIMLMIVTPILLKALKKYLV